MLYAQNWCKTKVGWKIGTITLCISAGNNDAPLTLEYCQSLPPPSELLHYKEFLHDRQDISSSIETCLFVAIQKQPSMDTEI